jgi:hypothetical protein
LKDITIGTNGISGTVIPRAPEKASDEAATSLTLDARMPAKASEDADVSLNVSAYTVVLAAVKISADEVVSAVDPDN